MVADPAMMRHSLTLAGPSFLDDCKNTWIYTTACLILAKYGVSSGSRVLGALFLKGSVRSSRNGVRS